jgi:hypothetical protein
MRRAFILVTAISILICSNSFAQNDQDKYFTQVLDSSLQAAQGGEDTVTDTLFSSAGSSENPKQLFVNLLDYYLGAGAGETLMELIIKEGDQMLPLLIKKRDTQLNCREEYQLICTESIENRNKWIDRLLDEISN